MSKKTKQKNRFSTRLLRQDFNELGSGLQRFGWTGGDKPLALHTSQHTLDTTLCSNLGALQMLSKGRRSSMWRKTWANPSLTWPLGLLLVGHPRCGTLSLTHDKDRQESMVGALHIPLEQFAQEVTFDQLGDKKEKIFGELHEREREEALHSCLPRTNHLRTFKSLSLVCTLAKINKK